jgi:hypothetical protein
MRRVGIITRNAGFAVVQLNAAAGSGSLKQTQEKWAGQAIVEKMTFYFETNRPASPRRKRWLSYALIFGLTLVATAVMMLCPCDTVGIHDYNAISLVALATLFGFAAAFVLYRCMNRDSGITGFLRAVIALAVVGVSVYVELFAAQEIVARLARRQ